MVLEDAAVKMVVARLGDGGDVGHAREFGVVVGLRDANLLDGIEGREHLVDGAGVFDTDRGDAVDGDGKHGGGCAHDVKVAAVVGLHAGLGGERGDGAGGTGGAGVDGDGKIDQFVAHFGLCQIGNVGIDDGNSIVGNNDRLRLGAGFESHVHAPGLARGE